MYRLKEIEHTADIGFVVSADSKVELVHGSINALTSIMGIDFQSQIETFNIKENGSIRISGEDDVDALIQTLNEWLYMCQVKRQYHLPVEIEWKGNIIFMRCDVYQLDETVKIETEIKAITYHNAYINSPNRTDPEWKTLWIADI